MSTQTRSASVVYRRMDERDVPAVARLEQALMPSSWREDLLHAELSRDGLVALVAADAANGVIGYCLARTAADQAEVYKIAVARSWQRRGIARELLTRVCAAVAARGAWAVFLEVRETNAAARAFYARNDFHEVGIRGRYYAGTGEDARVLRRDVSSSHIER